MIYNPHRATFRGLSAETMAFADKPREARVKMNCQGTLLFFNFIFLVQRVHDELIVVYFSRLSNQYVTCSMKPHSKPAIPGNKK